MREKSVLTLIGRLNNSNCLKSKKSLQPEKFDFIFFFFFFFSSPLHVLTLHFPQVETERKKERSDPIKTKKKCLFACIVYLVCRESLVRGAANPLYIGVCGGGKERNLRTFA